MRQEKGFVATIVVLALLALAVPFVLGVTYLSIGEAQSALFATQGKQTLFSAEGCAENALLLAVRDDTYAGGTFTLSGADCSVDVAKDTDRFTFDIVAERSGFSRHLEVVAVRSAEPPSFIIESWLER
jgi:hypothetical protein